MKVVITGAAGRMGKTLIECVEADNSLTLHSLLEREGAFQQDEKRFTDNPDKALNGADVVIDFTIAPASMDILKACVKHNVIHVIGTTGFSREQEAEIEAASKIIPIVKSGNYSLGVNVLSVLVEKAASILGEDFDIEILEMHHKKKVDAPSGTAMLLGHAAAAGRKVNLHDKAIYAREGHTGERDSGTIGFATLRGGTVIGDHDVIFAGSSERMILSHKAESREMFAKGALKAARWAKGKPPGLYSMRDVLGL